LCAIAGFLSISAIENSKNVQNAQSGIESIEENKQKKSCIYDFKINGKPLDTQTIKVLEILESINKIPRCSLKEKKVAEWLKAWAEERKYKVVVDHVNNVVITVPATPGYEQEPTLSFQGHLDMVCEKTPDSNHNFDTDPIEYVCDGDWLKANKTTLGADNALGVALALTVADNKTIGHPQIEILMTADEEGDFTGALAVKPETITSRRMINIDAEEEGVFVAGSVGTKLVTFTIPVTTEKIMSDAQAVKLQIGGLLGGHSGVDIDKGRANALKVIAHILSDVQAVTPLQIVTIAGGTKDNVIPGQAQAVFVFNAHKDTEVFAALEKSRAHYIKEFSSVEHAMTINFVKDESQLPEQVVSVSDSQKLITLLRDLPNGPHGLSPEFTGIVELSNNLGKLDSKDTVYTLISFNRAFDIDKLKKFTQEMEQQAKNINPLIKTSVSGELPSWKPNAQSPLLKKAQTVFKNTFGTDAKSTAVHGTLETGSLVETMKDLDVISIGATLKDIHSTNERLYVPSVPRVLQFLSAIVSTKDTPIITPKLV
jgi:dipeptidase D